jgi:hypothetical protein
LKYALKYALAILKWPTSAAFEGFVLTVWACVKLKKGGVKRLGLPYKVSTLNQLYIHNIFKTMFLKEKLICLLFCLPRTNIFGSKIVSFALIEISSIH